jgi:hypothetical protein
MPTLSKTIILFFDVEKYPPSLQYLLMTLGGIFILLAIGWGAIRGAGLGGFIETYGRVPLFFYILHLYVIHLAAGLLGYLSASAGAMAVSWWLLLELPAGRAAVWARARLWFARCGSRWWCCFTFRARGSPPSRSATPTRSCASFSVTTH